MRSSRSAGPSKSLQAFPNGFQACLRIVDVCDRGVNRALTRPSSVENLINPNII